MSVVENILTRITELGLRLTVDNDRILVFSVDGKSRGVPPDLVEQIRESKPLLLDYLGSRPAPGWGAVPPSDLPLRSAPVRVPPSERRLIINFVSRQLSDTKLADWLCDRQERYYAGIGRHWDCGDIMFTSAVDFVCWQLGRNIHESIQLLRGCNVKRH